MVKKIDQYQNHLDKTVDKYYYKDENNHDEVVSVPRIKEMYGQLGTEGKLKSIVEFPNAGGHAIQTTYMTNDVETVKAATYKFAEEVLDLKSVN